MGNMSYVRFENTFRDLEDCLNHMDDDLSESEQEYRQRLINLCFEIGVSWGNDEGGSYQYDWGDNEIDDVDDLSC